MDHLTAGLVDIRTLGRPPLAQAIIDSLTANGLTQADLRKYLAAELGGDPSDYKGQVSGWTNGVARPSGVRWTAVKDYLGWSDEEAEELKRVSWTVPGGVTAVNRLADEMDAAAALAEHIDTEMLNGQGALADLLGDSLGLHFRRRRLEREMSQVDLSRAAGVSTTMITELETNKGRPSPASLKLIAEALGWTTPEDWEPIKDYGYDLEHGEKLVDEPDVGEQRRAARAALAKRTGVRHLGGTRMPSTRKTRAAKAMDGFAGTLDQTYTTTLRGILAATMVAVDELEVDGINPREVTRRLVDVLINLDRTFDGAGGLFEAIPGEMQ